MPLTYISSVFRFRFNFTGLQAVLPEYLRSRFVQAALGYIGCNAEGQFVCRDNDCWCQCSTEYPQCNCPYADIRSQENYLEHTREAWTQANQEFEESGDGGFFLKKSVELMGLWMTSDCYRAGRYDQKFWYFSKLYRFNGIRLYFLKSPSGTWCRKCSFHNWKQQNNSFHRNGREGGDWLRAHCFNSYNQI